MKLIQIISLLLLLSQCLEAKEYVVIPAGFFKMDEILEQTQEQTSISIESKIPDTVGKLAIYDHLASVDEVIEAAQEYYTYVLLVDTEVIRKGNHIIIQKAGENSAGQREPEYQNDKLQRPELEEPKQEKIEESPLPNLDEPKEAGEKENEHIAEDHKKPQRSSFQDIEINQKTDIQFDAKDNELARGEGKKMKSSFDFLKWLHAPGPGVRRPKDDSFYITPIRKLSYIDPYFSMMGGYKVGPYVPKPAVLKIEAEPKKEEPQLKEPIKKRPLIKIRPTVPIREPTPKEFTIERKPIEVKKEVQQVKEEPKDEVLVEEELNVEQPQRTKLFELSLPDLPETVAPIDPKVLNQKKEADEIYEAWQRKKFLKSLDRSDRYKRSIKRNERRSR